MPRQGSDDLATAVGLVLGTVADALFGDPISGHPVALFGRAAAAADSLAYRDSRFRGALFTVGCVGLPVLAGALGQRVTRGRPWMRTAMVAATTWTVLGGTSLRREAGVMYESLHRGDLPAARARLPHLAGRDSSALDADELVRATVESVAENTSDAVVAPLVWGALAGLPGLLGYRAVNTLDAMVGYRTPRYVRFGWASARADDVANLVPARLTALLTVIAAPLGGGTRRGALVVWRRDGRVHPSPNAGHCEAAMAGALGIRLGGRNSYQGAVEDRSILGDPGAPGPSTQDLPAAIRLSGAVALLALLVTAGHVAARPWRRKLWSALGRAGR